MKVLLASDWYTPAINGVVTSVANLKKGLEARGHQVRVLTLSTTRRSYREGDVTYIGSISAEHIYPGARLRADLGSSLIKDLEEWGPEVVHTNCEFSTFLTAKGIAARCGAPLVHTYHTVYEDYTHYFSHSRRVGRRVVRRFSRIIAARTDCIIVPTEKVRRLLEGYGAKVPLYVIPTGVDMHCGAEELHSDIEEKRRMELRKKLKVPEENSLILYLGRLAREKNCEELIRAMAFLKNRPLTLMIAGGGPCGESLKNLARSLGLGSSVIFTGMIPPSEVSGYYKAADLFVSASTSETQGLTYMEALCSGLPLLCRRDDCLQDVVMDGKNGWLYDSCEELCSRLASFMDAPALSSDLRRNALETGRRYTVEAFAESVEKVYEKHLAERCSHTLA